MYSSLILLKKPVYKLLKVCNFPPSLISYGYFIIPVVINIPIYFRSLASTIIICKIFMDFINDGSGLQPEPKRLESICKIEPSSFAIPARLASPTSVWWSLIHPSRLHCFSSIRFFPILKIG